MAYILHIDTSSEKALIALSKNGEILYDKINEHARNHAAVINLMIEDVLKAAHIRLNDVSALSVVAGPGSYTGLRIGLATAKALCYVLDKPLMLFNKLELLSLQAQKDFEGRQYYLSVLPAREKEYFICMYNHEAELLIKPAHVFERGFFEIIQSKKEKLLITGSLNPAITDIAKEINAEYFDNAEIKPRFWAIQSLLKYNCNDFVSLAASEPFYLKQVFTHNKL